MKTDVTCVLDERLPRFYNGQHLWKILFVTDKTKKGLHSYLYLTTEYTVITLSSFDLVLCPTELPLGRGDKQPQTQRLRLQETGWIQQAQFIFGRGKPYILPTLPRGGETPVLASGSLTAVGDWYRSSCLTSWQLLLGLLVRPRWTHFGEVTYRMLRQQV